MKKTSVRMKIAFANPTRFVALALTTGVVTSFVRAMPELSRMPLPKPEYAGANYQGPCGCSVLGPYLHNVLFVPIRLGTGGRDSPYEVCIESYKVFEFGSGITLESSQNLPKTFGWPRWAECATPALVAGYKNDFLSGLMVSFASLLFFVFASKWRARR